MLQEGAPTFPTSASPLTRTGHKNPLREEEMTRRRNDIKEEKEGKEDR